MQPEVPAGDADQTTGGLTVRSRSGRSTPLGDAAANRALAVAAAKQQSRRQAIWLTGACVAMMLPWGLFLRPNELMAPYYLSVVLLSLVGYCLGIMLHRPSPGWPWWLIGAGLAARLLALLAAELTPDERIPPGAHLTLSLAVRLASFPLLAVGLIGVVLRSGPYRNHRVMDALAITYGGCILTWLLAIAPYLRSLSGADRWIAFATVLGDFALLAMSVMVFLVAIRHTAQALLGLAAFLLLAGDTIRWMGGGAPSGSVPPPGPGVALLSGYLLIAIAAAHHTVGSRRQAVEDDRPTGHLRIVLFGLVTFVYPAYVLLAAARHWRIAPLIDIAYPTLATTAFCFYLALRSAALAREAYRREREQASQAAALGAALAEQRALQGQLAHRALHDPLTGLANRAKLTDALDRVLTEIPEYALILVDLDGFKDVNDTRGHPVGDQLLIEVAGRFAAALPPEALLARLGGDEFAVLLSDADQARGEAAAQRLNAAMKTPFRLADHEFYLTASAGVFAGWGTSTPSDVLANADLALYAAKGEGKNRVVVYRPELRSAHLEQVELLAGLRRAVARGEFVLEYQPVVDLVTEQITSVEALIRWDLPGQGRIAPADFVPIAEECGLIVPIGAWALGQACMDAKEWYDRFGISVAVNVAAAQLRDPEFVTTVIGALRYSGLSPEALVLEITESTMIAATSAETEVVAARLNQLRGRGIRVAIDDFGTGYSSLSYLRRLPVDILKIDRAFSMDGPEGADSQDTALTRAILQLSHSLGLSTVAEGVETSERADVLRELRCDRAQGFLYSRPINAQALDDLLAGDASAAAAAAGVEPSPAG